MKRCVSIILACACLLSGTLAWAESPGRLGKSGQVALGVERLFGINYAKEKSDEYGFTGFALFGSSGLEGNYSPYSIPRLNIDVFVTDGFTVGIGAHYSTISRDNDSIKIFGLYPRIGYAVPLGGGFSFWPKAGLSYMHYSSDNSSRFESDSDSTYLLGASVEGWFVASPAPHFGIAFGPTADIGIAGSNEHKVNQFGFQAGILGWF